MENKEVIRLVDRLTELRSATEKGESITEAQAEVIDELVEYIKLNY